MSDLKHNFVHTNGIRLHYAFANGKIPAARVWVDIATDQIGFPDGERSANGVAGPGSILRPRRR